MQHYEGWGGYGAAKAALDHLTLTFAAETGLTAYAVDPGDMNTQMHADAEPGEDLSGLPSAECGGATSAGAARPATGDGALPRSRLPARGSTGAVRMPPETSA